MNIIVIVVLGIVAINQLRKALAYKPASSQAAGHGCIGMLVAVLVLIVSCWAVVYGGGL